MCRASSPAASRRVFGQLRDASGDVHAKAQRQHHRNDDAEQTDADQGAGENRDLAPYVPQAIQREGPLPLVVVVAGGDDLHRQAADPRRARQARFRGGIARAGVTEIFADDVEPLRQRAGEAKFRRTSARQHLLQLRERAQRRRQLPANKFVVSQIAFAMAAVESQHAAAGLIEECGGLIGLGKQRGEVPRLVGLNRVAPLQKERRAQQQNEKPQRHRAEQERALAKAQRFHRASALIRGGATS
jgi:hypothetical protein